LIFWKEKASPSPRRGTPVFQKLDQINQLPLQMALTHSRNSIMPSESRHNEIRRTNLKRLIDERYKGNQAAFARALGVKPPQINNMLHGKASIGNGMAQLIENIVGWQRGDLDKPPEKIITVYVFVSIPLHQARSLSEALHEYDCVKETAVVYGNDMEVFVKLQGTEEVIQNTLMQALSSYEGVRKICTSRAMEGLHWQKEHH
jgi:DNA-binding transcriptional regulator YdaS (Cro superfamily)